MNMSINLISADGNDDRYLTCVRSQDLCSALLGHLHAYRLNNSNGSIISNSGLKSLKSCQTPVPMAYV